MRTGKSQPHHTPCNLFLNAVHLRAVSCLRTAIPSAFFVPTTITSFLPLVTALPEPVTESQTLAERRPYRKLGIGEWQNQS